ncbi:MAG: hypothetical protein AAGF01_12560 [Cyanobacteria bacterium P01_G01_bin.38]
MSDPQNLWIVPALVEEGSFCDAMSKIHYDNLSEEGTQKAIDDANIRGDGVIDCRYTGGGENLSNNTTIMSVDRLQCDYPTRYRPGE